MVTYPAFENHGRFKFRAFRFLRRFPSVYLQCDIVICDSNNTNSRCARGCISRHRRAISPYTWKTNTVVGPIRLKRDLRAAEHSGKREKIFHMCALQSGILLLLQIIKAVELFQARLNPPTPRSGQKGIERTVLRAETKSTMPLN